MGTRTKVLILSAERSYRDALRWALAEVVDDVLITASWSRVVPLVDAQRPSVAVLDFDSIDRSGRAVLVRMLTQRFHIAVIAIGTKSAIEDAETLGVATTLPKPLNIGVLMGHVERMVEARQDA